MSSLATEKTLFQIYRPNCPTQLEPLKTQWNALAEKHRSPTARIEWSQSGLATLLARGEPKAWLFTLLRDERLTALALMRERRVVGGAFLEDLGTREMGEPADLLYESLDDLEALLTNILRLRWPLVLCRLPASSQVPDVLRSLLRGRGFLRLAPGEKYPYVALEQFPEGQLNNGRRSDLRRMRRRAERIGPIRIDMRCPQLAEVDSLFDQAMAIEASSWKIETGFAMSQNAVGQQFLRDYARRATHAGILRFAFLYLGDRPAAMQIATQCGGGFWLLKIGYDAHFSSVAPGQLLMQNTMQASVERGLRTYELFGAADIWTRMWTTQELDSTRLKAYPLGWRSARLLLAMPIRKLLSKPRVSASAPAHSTTFPHSRVPPQQAHGEKWFAD